MNTHQKNTYLIFGRGLDPTTLTLGTLLSDPANPEELSPFVHASKPDDLLKWTRPPQKDTDCSLTFTATRGWMASLDLLSLMDGHTNKDTEYKLKVTGKNGVRKQLKEPEEYLNKVVLHSQEVLDWLVSRLCVNRMVLVAKTIVRRSPEIWMVTGLQEIEGGTISLNNGSNSSTGAGFTVPLPDPTGSGLVAAALSGSGTISAKGEVKGSNQSSNDYKHDDSRVWAAQFMQLNIKLKREVPGSSDKTTRSSNDEGWVKLRKLVDLGKKGVRTDSDSEQDSDDEGDDGREEEMAKDEFVLLKDTKIKDYQSAEVHASDIVEYTQAVDWTEFKKYLEQEEALTRDRKTRQST